MARGIIRLALLRIQDPREHPVICVHYWPPAPLSSVSAMAHDEKAHRLPIKAERAGSGSAEHGETIRVEPNFLQAISYGPSGLWDLLGSKYVFSAAILASLCGFSMGYDMGAISIINVMDQFYKAYPFVKTAFSTEFMTAMLLLGAFVGCIFIPYMADHFIRKWTLTVVVIMFDIGAILQTAAPNYLLL